MRLKLKLLLADLAKQIETFYDDDDNARSAYARDLDFPPGRCCPVPF